MLCVSRRGGNEKKIGEGVHSILIPMKTEKKKKTLVLKKKKKKKKEDFTGVLFQNPWVWYADSKQTFIKKNTKVDDLAL